MMDYLFQMYIDNEKYKDGFSQLPCVLVCYTQISKIKTNKRRKLAQFSLFYILLIPLVQSQFNSGIILDEGLPAKLFFLSFFKLYLLST
jgi:hypothetical protein